MRIGVASQQLTFRTLAYEPPNPLTNTVEAAGITGHDYSAGGKLYAGRHGSISLAGSFDTSASKRRNVRKGLSRNSELFDRTVPGPGAFALVRVGSV